MEATDGPLLASVPAPCSQMERWLLASPSPEEPETSPLPTLFQGEGKLEPQTLIHWSDPNLPIWGEHSEVQGPHQSGLVLQPVSLSLRRQPGLSCLKKGYHQSCSGGQGHPPP